MKFDLVLLSLILSSFIVSGCIQEKKSTQQVPFSPITIIAIPNTQITAYADQIQIQSLKYPNKKYPAIAIVNGVIQQLPHQLYGQDQDLFVIHYLKTNQNKGFLCLTKAQIYAQQSQLYNNVYLIEHGFLAQFLSLSYIDMIKFKNNFLNHLNSTTYQKHKYDTFKDIFQSQ